MGEEQKNSEEVKQKAGTNKAKADVINIDMDYDGKKKLKKSLVKRLSHKNEPKTAKEIQARMDKASETRDAIVKSRVEMAATESKKVEEAKVRKGTDKAKEARAL